jgi:uncharacterized Fe-S center protein
MKLEKKNQLHKKIKKLIKRMRVKKIIRGEKILNQRVNLNENSFNKRKT